MVNHAGSEMSNWQSLLFVVAFTALGDGFEVGSQGLVNAIETLELLVR